MTPSLDSLLPLVRQAGSLILDCYRHTKLETWLKTDDSPVTVADQRSHAYLATELKEAFGCPVLSEEDPIPRSERKTWSEFFLLDPLDGTRDFLDRNDEFSISLAFMQNNAPVIGLIYSPVSEEVYFARKGEGIVYLQKGKEKAFSPYREEEPTVVCSRHHHSQDTERFIRENSIVRVIRKGSALKFGLLATGHANLYPRFVGSKEWDIAAGQILVEEAGFQFIDLVTGRSPVYNQNDHFKNNPFLVFDKNLSIRNFKAIPENLENA